MFTQLERREIYETYVRNNYNRKQARREYQRTYPARRPPSLNTFKRVYDHVLRENCFQGKKRSIIKNQNEENEELNIILYFQGNLLKYYSN